MPKWLGASISDSGCITGIYPKVLTPPIDFFVRLIDEISIIRVDGGFQARLLTNGREAISTSICSAVDGAMTTLRELTAGQSEMFSPGKPVRWWDKATLPENR